jgi:hypothetical protein
LRFLEEIEATDNVRSTLNFSGYYYDSTDSFLDKTLNPSYDISRVEVPAKSSHFEIGIHGSTRAFFEESRYKKELERVSRHDNVIGGRQHMLSFEFNKTFEIFNSAGLKYDTSMGFNDFNGYRNGSAFVHHPVSTSTDSRYSFYEYPLVFMDSVFTKKGYISRNRILAEAEEFANTVAETPFFTGSLCWHDSAFYRDSELAGAYSDIIKTLKKKDIFLGCGQELHDFHNSVTKISLVSSDNSMKLVVPEKVPGGLWIGKMTRNSTEALSRFEPGFSGEVPLGQIN